MSKKRKKYSPEQKVEILKKHLVDKVAVSDLCDQYGLHPTVFYRWQKAFFEGGAAAVKKSKAATRPVWKKIFRPLNRNRKRRGSSLRLTFLSKFADVRPTENTISCDAVNKAPVITKFKFRTDSQRIDSMHNRTTMKTFYGTPFVFLN